MKISDSNWVVTEDLDGIDNYNDYFYIISNLYSWTKESKYLKTLGIFLENTITNYNVIYNDFKNIVREIILKYGQYTLISCLVISIPVEDIKSLVSDYSEQAEFIFNGIIKKHLMAESDEKERISILIKEFIYSDNVTETFIGIKCYECVADKGYSILHLLDSKNDDIILEGLKYIEKGKYDEKLLKMIFKRAMVDRICVESLSKLNIDAIDEKDISRIYSLFYIAPLEYVKYECYKYGFILNDNIAQDLVNCLQNIYDPVFFNKVADLLRSYSFTNECYNLVIENLDCNNFYYKKWAFTKLTSIEVLDKANFIKICFFIANEIDINLVIDAVEMLRIYFIDNKRTEEHFVYQKIFTRWLENKKLECLIRRIFPIFDTSKEKWAKLLERCDNNNEVLLLQNLFNK